MFRRDKYINMWSSSELKLLISIDDSTSILLIGIMLRIFACVAVKSFGHAPFVISFKMRKLTEESVWLETGSRQSRSLSPTRWQRETGIYKL